MKKILPIIVLAQFFCTSLWFAGNVIISDVANQYNLAISVAGLTIAVQAGFIVGTFVFALLNIADRFSPVRLFCTCALVASVINLAIILLCNNMYLLLTCRFLTGFFLAGIYPVGMKIAADHYQHGLGRSLGFLVGALVLGTAFPHFLKSVIGGLPWQYIVYATSALAVLGGVAMVAWVPDGPYRKPAQQFRLNGFMHSFKDPDFRAAALGYFGHMWELYAYWAFVPFMFGEYQHRYPLQSFNVSLLSFFIIVAGSFSCILSGLLSQRFGARRIATYALTASCCCCVLSPLVLFNTSFIDLIIFMLIWSMTVIADSPLFSTLVAQHAIPEVKGTSLTIVNCIGFSVTIASIQILSVAGGALGPQYCYVLLGIGPALGLIALRKKGC